MGQSTKRPAVSLGAGIIALALCLAGQPAAAAAHGRPRTRYTTTPAGYRTIARFVVTYVGSGHWRTVYHSEPPNPGGHHDTNDAHDSSRQHWSLRFARVLTVPSCGRSPRGQADPCLHVDDLTGAEGETTATGTIAHTHVDGLYIADNTSASCRVATATPAGTRLAATVTLRYVPVRRTISVTALIPVEDALNLLPGTCPEQGDSLDGLLDNYFTPGFSFGAGFGPLRWFTSEQVEIPAEAFHRSARIRVPLAQTPRGTPPRDCVVHSPSFERCTTGGSWAGVLSFSARP